MARRDNPNSYYAWYNDDDRLAIVERQTNSTDAKGITAGEYDTYTDSTVTDGIKMTIHSKYETAVNLSDDLQTTCGLSESMHVHVLEYVKSRILEDMGDLEKAGFFKAKYDSGVMKKPTRKSGIRVLLVPEL
jgi:hypothetical protein